MTTNLNPFCSARLLYRAVEPATDEDFFLKIQQDPIAFQNSNARVSSPQARSDAKRMMTHVSEKALLGVVICLPPSSQESQPIQDSRSTPIGVIHLEASPPHLSHHRHTEIGIDIVAEYQGQGYGSEAINWVLEWAFNMAGMHRVAIRAFEYNDGAVRLYEKLGFKLEGRSREALWFNGRFWDDVQYGMLEQEWRARREQKQ